MAGSEQAFLATPLAAAGGRVIASPFQFLTTGEDNLRIVTANSQTGVVVTVRGRLLDLNRDINSTEWTIAPATDRSISSREFSLAPGAVLNLSVFASSGSPLIGQTYVIVQLIRGSGAAAIVLGTLLAGYVTSTQHLAWPGSPIESSITGGGYPRTITGTAPAANTIITETVPTGARWEVRGVRATLSNPAASRPIFMRFKDPSGNTIGGSWSSFLANLAPTVNEFIATAGYVQQFQNALGTRPEIMSQLPFPVALLAGGSFTVEYDPIAFQFSAPTYHVREWLEVN